ncbi:MAG: hypothetical protein Q9191_005367 [Dirinaria sp. TL-2023a]
MSVEDINTRLVPLFDSHKQTLRLINRLAKFPSQPGSTAPGSESADARVELGTVIHQSLKELDEEFELLRQDAEDLTNVSSWTSGARRKDSERERERTDLAAQVTRLGENLKTARNQFRKAQLQAKRNAEAAKQKERELLFTGLQEGNAIADHPRRKATEKLSEEEQLLQASSDVTAALRNAHALMSQELSKSQFAQETLDASTATLQSLSESYNNLDNLLSSSRTLVSSLLHSQKSDTWYLESAFWILVTTICWLVFRRILYGPGWWLIYLPLRLVWKLMVFNAQLILSLFATIVGSVGAAKQSDALLQASERISTSLIVKPSATGGFPRYQPNMPAPSVAVGAGGSGVKAPQPGAESSSAEKSLSERVGQMAEQSQEVQRAPSTSSENAGQETVLRERNDDEPPNPKKRIWEEPRPEVPTEGSRARDEL